MSTRETSTEKAPCKCQNCGDGCKGKAGKQAKTPEAPQGFFAQRPWIWILLGYIAMVGSLGVMVTIAIKHPQADVLKVQAHGR